MAQSSPSKRCRSYRYLLQPTARQRVELEGLLRRQCELYNAALEERRGAWTWERRSVSRFDQYLRLTTLRESRPEILAQGTRVCRGTLKRLDLAFAAFYRRCRTGQTPGFPRFKPVARWNSVQWDDGNGCRLLTDEHRLRLFGIGHIKVRLHRPLVGTPKTIIVGREGRRWWVTIHCADIPNRPMPLTGREVGIDLGVCSLAATSDGGLISEGRYGHCAADGLAAAQRNLATKRRGSKRRQHAVDRVARAHRKIRNQRKNLAHQLSRRLVNDYDLIAHEDLKIRNMVRRGTAAKTGLNRSIHDAAWGQLLAMLTYKAEDAGRQIIAVDPRHTSQRCARCGHVERTNRVSQAVFRCTSCGHEAHADVNAAVNILEAGRVLRASACAASK